MDRARRAFATFLAFSMALGPIQAFAQTAPDPDNLVKNSNPRPAYRSNQLRGDERILQALNRFTWGPRPGDLAAVRSIGLDNWFEQQLHPAGLDQADLNTRLAQFPSLQVSPADLLYRFPTNAMIRQTMDGKIAMPQNAALQAIYQNQIARYDAKKQEKAANRTTVAQNAAPGQTPPQTMAMAANAPAMSSEAGGEAMATPPARAEDDAQPAFDDKLLQEVIALPPQQRVDRVLSMKPDEFESFIKALKGPGRAAFAAGLSPAWKEVVIALANPRHLVVSELDAERLTRDTYSNSQLLEVMTDFWLNHFNVYVQKNEETPYYLASYERDVIRPHALGKFEDLLEATAHSPAMMLYLDNASSMGPDSIAAERAKMAEARQPGAKKKPREGLNENYARELMELHTLGVNGGYTQADVTQVARVFTGWTVDQPQRGGGFNFNENRHEPGTKTVLGQKIKEDGEIEGREVLHMLATSPATAQFLSRKIAMRFVSDQPPQALVDRMAKAYLLSGGDISQVLRAMYRSPEFWSSEAYRAKVKTPVEFVVSALRAGDYDIQNYEPLANALQGMGMKLYGSVPPTGYNWQASTWVSTGALVNRMNFALQLAANRFPGVTTAWTEQAVSSQQPSPTLVSTPSAASASTPESEEQRLESMLVVGGVNETTRAAVLQQFEAQGGRAVAPGKASTPVAIERQDQLLAGLLLGSPEFQRR